MANFLVKLEEINHSIRAAKRGFHLQLELEFYAIHEPLKDYTKTLKSINISGPNLGSLLLAARCEEIEKWKGKTYNGGVMYGYKNFSKLQDLLNSSMLVPTFIAGRAGSASAVTRMTIAKERSVTNNKFRQGEKLKGGVMDLEQIIKENKLG